MDMWTVLALGLAIHESWVALQHANTWLNPYVQRLDRKYGVALVKKSQHAVITFVLGEYWSREVVTTAMSLWVLSPATPLALYMLSLYTMMYHIVKVSLLLHDGLTQCSASYGILSVLLVPLRASGWSALRLALQGIDTLQHVYMAHALASQWTGTAVPLLTLAVWVWHQATVLVSGQSTATRPVERARRVVPPCEHPHAATYGGDIARLLRPLDADTPVHTVLLAHPGHIADMYRLLYRAREPYVSPDRWWLRALAPLSVAYSLVVLFLWPDRPVVCDRFLVHGVWTEVWFVPVFGYQYLWWPGRAARRVRRIVRHATTVRGARRVVLGALNKAHWIEDGGRGLADRSGGPDVLQIEDGNLLTAAVLCDHIRRHLSPYEDAAGSRGFCLVGPTSKVGAGVARYWAARGVAVACVTASRERFRHLRDGTAEVDRCRIVRADAADLTGTRGLVVFCKGGSYDLHPDSVALTTAVPAPVFGRRPRRVVEAGRVAYDQTPFRWHMALDTGEMYPCMATGTVPSLDPGRHFVGSVDHTRVDVALAHAATHGIRPLVHDRDVVVVGSGVAGVVAMEHARARGDSALMVGRDETPGGNWLRVAPCTALTSHSRYLGLPGAPDIATAADMLAYITERCQRLDMRLGDGVARVDKVPGGFRVETESGATFSTRRVVIATGHGPPLGVPPHHRIDATLVDPPGRALPTEPSRILVLGGGNTAVDTALALVAAGHEVRMSVRSCPVVVPHHGILQMWDIEQFLGLHRRFPWVARLLPAVAWMHGTSIRGAVPAQSPTKVSRIVVDRGGFARLVQTGRLRTHPALAALDADGVSFVDGSSWTPDRVVCCYGAEPGTKWACGMGVTESPLCTDLRECLSYPSPIHAMVAAVG